MLKIGDLAKSYGLSIRTLRHYDDFGLLVASGRTESGYRLYAKRDIQRLQHILFLKQLGFSLKKISEMLSNQSSSLIQTIDEHVLFVEQNIHSQTALLKQLKYLQDNFSTAKNIAIDDFFETIEMMKMYQKYFDEKQLAEFATAREALGKETLNQLQQKVWPDLIAKVKKAMDDQLAADSEEVTDLAKQWMELAHQFTGGDSKIAESVGKMYQQEKALQDKTGIHQPMMDFISQAWKHYQNQNQE